MKKNPWLRFFFSYLYIFLSIVLMLFLIFLYLIGSNAKEEAVNANRVYAQNVLKTFDDYLNNINQTVIRDILTNTKMQLFFNSNTDDTLANYELYSKLKDTMSTIHGIDSIYLYRTSDNKVLSDSFTVDLDDFEDKSFVETRMSNSEQVEWSSPRPFVYYTGNPSQQVVSLVKTVSFGNAHQGLIVVNMLAYSLQSTLNDLIKSDVHYAFFTDQEHVPLFTSHTTTTDLPIDTSYPYQSQLTHWTLNTGLKNRTIIHFLSLLSYSWLIFAGIVVISGIFMLFYVYRKNYKPIDVISNRIQLFIKKNTQLMEHDQFAFIESSIEKLITESEQYEKQAAENQIVKRNYFFRALISGTNRIHQLEWNHELRSMGVDNGSHSYLVLLIEMDEYDAFELTYNARDQTLLKFALRSAIQEISDQYTISLWNNWLFHNRLCHLIVLNPDKDVWPILRMCEQFNEWVEQFLKFTVTIGVGEVVDNFSAIPHSYDSAFEMLEMKAAVGQNRVISQETVIRSSNASQYESLESIRALIRHFIALKDNWEEALHSAFREMRANHLSRKAIASLADYLLYHLNREIKGLPENLQSIWYNELLPPLTNTIKHFDKIERLEQQYLITLKRMSEHIQAKREINPHYRDITAIKDYIERHYTDPSLSLNQVSDQFRLSPPYFSTMFKEIQGEKFIDFLTKLRMNKAKLLLETTEESIQDIALSVGYIHSFSFIRVFKKLEELTPGEYRKAILAQNKNKH
ncbi:helix-turn-helix transcriptional regulator [Paenibacillus sp. SYP-B3998]|uniref:Helix-turn-helix transcriptional regulator n=1 Tax=Paenibacillus sp. SYP-B3998 TaxID=2678564 RepID=A0A6G3ZYA6_9BACL|nr:helix-turn-helix domain-containing protein [Paenibacillus sp. SYP-B3998]NEW07122.1 helix-turn-helix transcriptional regulator [Paenibacillus sp. SYP-B3998]